MDGRIGKRRYNCLGDHQSATTRANAWVSAAAGMQKPASTQQAVLCAPCARGRRQTVCAHRALRAQAAGCTPRACAAS
eukprot:364650-Chlamydomonas_euryale.AAC.2